MENKIRKIIVFGFHSLVIFFLFCNIFSLINLMINNFTVLIIVLQICLLLILTIGVSHGSLR